MSGISGYLVDAARAADAKANTDTKRQKHVFLFRLVIHLKRSISQAAGTTHGNERAGIDQTK